MDYELSKGKSYIIEWVDSLNFAGWNTSSDAERIATKSEDLITTYGEYIGRSDGGIYISIAQSIDQRKGVYSNVIKIPIKCIMKINQIDKGVPSTTPIVAFLALILGASAFYFSFNPSQFAINKVIETITDNYKLILINNGTSN